MADYSQARAEMVERQIAGRDVKDAGVLRAMRAVPREEFVPEELRPFAYDDAPLPIGEGQTISQPYVVALMVEAANLRPEERALEIGTGSGYAAAVMAEIAAQVYTVERHASLAEAARRRLSALGYANVEVRTGDGTLGLPDAAPFDAIICAASGPDVPDAWKEQITTGGRIVMPVGGHYGGQQLVRLVRRDQDHFDRDLLGGVRFVPLVGAQGWQDRPDPPAPNPRKRPRRG